MIRLQNLTNHRIEWTVEGKTYVWEPGEAMDVSDGIGRHLLRRLNSLDFNAKRAHDERGRRLDNDPWVREVDIPEEEKKKLTEGVIHANIPAAKLPPVVPSKRTA